MALQRVGSALANREQNRMDLSRVMADNIAKDERNRRIRNLCLLAGAVVGGFYAKDKILEPMDSGLKAHTATLAKVMKAKKKGQKEAMDPDALIAAAERDPAPRKPGTAMDQMMAGAATFAAMSSKDGAEAARVAEMANNSRPSDPGLLTGEYEESGGTPPGANFAEAPEARSDQSMAMESMPASAPARTPSSAPPVAAPVAAHRAAPVFHPIPTDQFQQQTAPSALPSLSAPPARAATGGYRPAMPHDHEKLVFRSVRSTASQETHNFVKVTSIPFEYIPDGENFADLK